MKGLLSTIYWKLYSFKAPLFTSQDKRYASYEIGDYTYGQPEVFSWGENSTLKIGRFCSIATGVKILLGGAHRSDWVTTFPFPSLFKEARDFPGHPFSRGDVIINHDVWIQMDAMILSGVTVGSGAIISSRSVVTKDVKPYSVVAGVPAEHVKFRFEDDIVNRLLEISWWNWPIDDIMDALPLLLSSDVRKFVDEYTVDK